MRTAPLSPDTVLPLLNTITPVAPRDRESPLDTVTAPVVVTDTPELNTTKPLEPLTAKPLAKLSEPDEPVPVVPLLNTIAPLSPFDAAFAVRSVIEPDDDTEPAPLDT